MLDAHLRHSATTLLKLAIRIAPPDTRDWGQAMMSELHYVEGPWAAAMWALGGSSVLAREALVSLVIPHGRGEYIPDGGLFAKSRTLRNAALSLSAAVVLAALLFFAAPPFRQAFRVAMTPWYRAYQFASGNAQPGLVDLARRAEAQHDAEGLAFCAVRLQDPVQSARLAEEAVNLDSNLVWVYSILAGLHPDLPQAGAWVEKLERSDPRNALVFLNAAEAINPKPLYEGKFAALTPEQQQKWQRAMTAAFAAPKFDDYLDRLTQLDRRVAQRFDYNDPYDLESRLLLVETQYAFENAVRYAGALLDTGAALEAKGDRKRAREQYWRVARFGQLVDSQGRTEIEHRMGTALQGMAYRQFHVSYQREGDAAPGGAFWLSRGQVSSRLGRACGISGGRVVWLADGGAECRGGADFGPDERLLSGTGSYRGADPDRRHPPAGSSGHSASPARRHHRGPHGRSGPAVLNGDALLDLSPLLVSLSERPSER